MFQVGKNEFIGSRPYNRLLKNAVGQVIDISTNATWQNLKISKQTKTLSFSTL